MPPATPPPAKPTVAYHRPAPARSQVVAVKGGSSLVFQKGGVVLVTGSVGATLRACQDTVTESLPPLAAYTGGRFRTTYIGSALQARYDAAARAGDPSTSPDDPLVRNLTAFTELPTRPGGGYETYLGDVAMASDVSCVVNDVHERAHKKIEEDRYAQGLPRYSGAKHEMLAYGMAVQLLDELRTKWVTERPRSVAELDRHIKIQMDLWAEFIGKRQTELNTARREATMSGPVLSQAHEEVAQQSRACGTRFAAFASAKH